MGDARPSVVVSVVFHKHVFHEVTDPGGFSPSNIPGTSLCVTRTSVVGPLGVDSIPHSLTPHLPTYLFGERERETETEDLTVPLGTVYPFLFSTKA